MCHVISCHVHYQVPGGHEIDDDSWTRDWGSKTPVTERAYDNSCPACGDSLRAVGLTNDERARIRETLFGLAGLQVKKHARSRSVRNMEKLVVESWTSLEGCGTRMYQYDISWETAGTM